MKISEVLDSKKSTTKAWYPSSGLDFKDLLFLGQNKFIFDKNVFANEVLNFEEIPDLFIHTDSAYTSDNWPLPKQGVIYEDEESVYKILKSEGVVGEIGGKLLTVEIQSDLLETNIEKKVLFLFSDNILFFKNYILKNKISIDFLINIRDGYSENGGADYSLKMLEFYLGLMNTKYLISDNFGRSPMDISKFKDDKIMMESFRSEKNYHTVLQGLKEWSWSEFGTFNGDAFLMMVNKFF